MKIYSVESTCQRKDTSLLAQLSVHLNELRHKSHTLVPVRFAVTRSSDVEMNCVVGMLDAGRKAWPRPILECNHREYSRNNDFNAVMVVPTGIGAEMGGHAGDATPAARLIGSVCDNLILHPNVVNASTINEMPGNALYVEGSVLSGLLMGQYALRPVRSNRVLVVLDGRAEKEMIETCVNNLSAARAVLGVDLEYIVMNGGDFTMRTEYTSQGVAVGSIDGFRYLLGLVKTHLDDFDAFAIGSVIETPEGANVEYMTSPGELVNPWGGCEAMLTHALTMMVGKPCAHAPLMETMAELDEYSGIVDPRKAAEAAAADFMYCVVKGLAKAPQIAVAGDTTALTVNDVDCVVMPDGCLGIPTLACIEQKIPLILVRNRNWMRNDLRKVGNFIHVDSYLEAAGVVVALREGISVESFRRPIEGTVECS